MTLLSSLETAEAGSRELSDKVLEALGIRFNGGDPTRSLDDALALVGKDWRTVIQVGAAYDNGKYMNDAGARLMSPLSSGHSSGEGFAATPALAVCSALIRAEEG